MLFDEYLNEADCGSSPVQVELSMNILAPRDTRSPGCRLTEVFPNQDCIAYPSSRIKDFYDVRAASPSVRTPERRLIE